MEGETRATKWELSNEKQSTAGVICPDQKCDPATSLLVVGAEVICSKRLIAVGAAASSSDACVDHKLSPDSYVSWTVQSYNFHLHAVRHLRPVLGCTLFIRYLLICATVV